MSRTCESSLAEKKSPDGLYHCNSWFNHYFISPQGILQPCHLTKECSTDLKKGTFKEGLDRFLGLLKIKYKADSKCITCELARARKNGIRAEV